MTLPFRIKVCGLTDVENALACVEAGAQALGLNFYPASKRYCAPERAEQIVRALPTHVAVVGLFVNAPNDEVRMLRDRCGFEWVQLHGDETPEAVRALGPKAYKAVNGESARIWPGTYLMVDAPRPDKEAVPGGHGRTWQWEKARAVTRAPGQRLILAGGLDASNAHEAIVAAQPDAVDVASGVETAPGRKDPQRVREFVQNALRALHSGA